MGKKVYFLDSVEQSDGSYNNTYGVDDVNAIVSNLVGAGVAPFPSGNTYDVSELNSLTSALVAEGTSLDGLKVSFADNKIHIAQGIGYFENGATIVVDSDGEELDYNVAETLYVYAEFNQALNTCGFHTSEKEPSSSTGIYVLILATIAADGTVTDKRTIAQSKVATLGRNECKEYVVFENCGGKMFYNLSATEDAILWEQEVDISKFNIIVINAKSEPNPGVYNIVNAVTKIKEGNVSVGIVDFLYRSYIRYVLRVRYKEGKLQVYIPPYDAINQINSQVPIHEIYIDIY